MINYDPPNALLFICSFETFGLPQLKKFKNIPKKRRLQYIFHVKTRWNSVNAVKIPDIYPLKSDYKLKI